MNEKFREEVRTQSLKDLQLQINQMGFADLKDLNRILREQLFSVV